MERSIRATSMVLVLLSCLFILTLVAPREWESIVRDQSEVGRVLPAIQHPAISSREFIPTESASRPLAVLAGPSSAGMPIEMTTVDESPGSPSDESRTDSSDDFTVMNLPFEGPDNAELFFTNFAEHEACEHDPFTIHELVLESGKSAAATDTTLLVEPAREIATAPEIAPTTGPQLSAPLAEQLTEPRYHDDARPASLARVPSRPVEPAATLTEAADELEIGQHLHEAAQAEQADVRTAAGWPSPAGLRLRLEELQSSTASQGWAHQVSGQLDELAACGGPRSAGAAAPLAELRELTAQGERIAMRLEREAEAEALRRTNYALQRRLVVWEHVAALPTEPDVLVDRETAPPDRLLAHLSRVDELTATAPQGKSWRDYLLLDGLRELAENRQDARERRRRMAREVLNRMSSGKLSLKQRRFATTEQMAALRSELRHWAADPVDVDQLMREIEYFEETRSASSGEVITSFYHQLAASSLPAAQRLAKELDMHYRGANLRIVVTDTLLTKMMPDREPIEEYVREELLGIPTAGQTTTTTTLSVHLVPDPHRLRFVLECSGLVHARTSAQSTGATVFAGMNSSFQILKPFELTLDGMKSDWASADAQTRTHLRGVDTPLSGIPVVGTVVDGIVRQQYRERRAEAEQELRRKIIRKAVSQMEHEVEERLANSNEQMRNRVLIPLERLQLHPTVAEMQTTQERLTLRLRLAAEHQLAALTPRPRAPSDSLASFQVHESVLNNVFNQLDLNGREFSQADLFRWVAERLNLPADKVPDNLRDDVMLTFAPRDAFRVTAQEGRLEINLHLDELRAEGNTFRDFTVRVFYRPDEESPTGDLVRDGVVQLIGKRINMKGQVALRGIFSKTFPREKRFSLLPARFLEDPKLADVRVTQMVVTDGWIGIALGQDRTRLALDAQRAARTP